MKSYLKAAAVGLLALGVTAGTAVAQDVTLRMQHFVSNRASVPAYFILPWARAVEAGSRGRIKVEIYPSMQLGGSPPSLYDQIRDGVVDGGWAIPGYTPGRFPAAEVFELPFMASLDGEATSRALWEFYEQYMAEELGEVKVLGMHVHGPGIIHVRDRRVERLEDMEGLKLRAPTRIASALLEELGAAPVGMPVPAFPEALSKGVVDGGVIPWEIVPPLKVHELATSHTVIGGDRALYNTVFIWGMNRDTYDSLDPELKTVIDHFSGMFASAWAGRAMDSGDGPAEALVRATDNEIIEITDEAELARWREVGERITAQWIEERTAEGMPAAEMVEAARALVAKYDN
ncbi:MAG: TRAP transporter substrate-binding protein [Pseudomonadota bacterium]